MRSTIDAGIIVRSFVEREDPDPLARIQLVSDGSLGPVEYRFTAPSGFNVYVSRIVFSFVADYRGWNALLFGVLPALPNGLQLEIEQPSGVTSNLLGSGDERIETNGDFYHFGFDVEVIETKQGLMRGVFDFNRISNGRPLIVREDYSILVTNNDDLTGFDEATVGVEGLILGVNEDYDNDGL